jgi:hypothetical protein
MTNVLNSSVCKNSILLLVLFIASLQLTFAGADEARVVEDNTREELPSISSRVINESSVAVYTPAPQVQKISNEKPVSILETNDILAYYGHPSVYGMGILGRMPLDAVYDRLSDTAEKYREAGGRDIKKAFYIIFGTAQAEKGNIVLITNPAFKNILNTYLIFAKENDMLIFLDHQIGKYAPADALGTMLPYLRHDNVHLALDPEWHTTEPNVKIGFVTADEINRAQEVMEEYIVENNIQGKRMLVLHQFNGDMIKNRAAIKSDFPHVELVLCMDGHGNPAKKKDSYGLVARAQNIPSKGFKLFYNERGNSGVDVPLLSPEEVYALSPRPKLIMYQ